MTDPQVALRLEQLSQGLSTPPGGVFLIKSMKDASGGLTPKIWCTAMNTQEMAGCAWAHGTFSAAALQSRMAEVQKSSRISPQTSAITQGATMSLTPEISSRLGSMLQTDPRLLSQIRACPDVDSAAAFLVKAAATSQLMVSQVDMVAHLNAMAGTYGSIPDADLDSMAGGGSYVFALPELISDDSLDRIAGGGSYLTAHPEVITADNPDGVAGGDTAGPTQRQK